MLKTLQIKICLLTATYKQAGPGAHCSKLGFLYDPSSFPIRQTEA